MKRGKRGQRKKSSPKQSLNLPDLDQAKSAVLNSLTSKESQRGYRHAIDEFINWYCSGLCRKRRCSTVGLDANTVVHGISQALLTAKISLGRLNGDMAQQKLNLVQFPSGIGSWPPP